MMLFLPHGHRMFQSSSCFARDSAISRSKESTESTESTEPNENAKRLQRERDIATYCISRPLIDFTRLEITFLTTLEALPISVDSTNYEYQATRSQIRYGLIPFLQKLGFDDLEEKVNIDELTGTRTRN